MTNALQVAVHLEDGSFWATINQYPGVFATGDNLDELRESLEEGLALVLSEPDGPVAKVTLGALRPAPVETLANVDLALA